MKLWDTLHNRLTGALAGLQLGARGLEHVAIDREEALIRASEAEDRANEALDRRAAGVTSGKNLEALMLAASSQESEIFSGKDSKVKEAASLAEIELALEDTSWRDLGAPYGTGNFSRLAIRRMCALSRVMYLVNPLIKRAVTVQELYVWGSGCTIKADSDKVQEVLDDFYKDRNNQNVIGASWQEREREQRIEGNTFFVFFINRKNGTSRVRLIPSDQVEDVICNPNDSKEPWYYLRTQIAGSFGEGDRDESAYLYPDIDYNPPAGTYPPTYRTKAHGDVPIKWDARILHVKTGGLSTMKFGIPELFASLNWATAYKKILENFATILAAYARVAMQLKGVKGKAGVAASKAKMGTAINGVNGPLVDTNPPTNTASVLLSSGSVELSAIKTAHSTTGPDEARALRSMVAAGSDTPEHFFGDSDIGNFATSTTLDRPTELKMVSRQKMWSNVIDHINEKLIEWSAYYEFGKLKEAGFRAERERDPFDNTTIFKVSTPRSQSTNVTVTFPSILERDVVQRVRAVVQAATLGGSKAEGIIRDRKTLFKLLWVALGEKDVDKVTKEMYPESVMQGFINPTDEAVNDRKKADAALLKAKQKPKPGASGSD